MPTDTETLEQGVNKFNRESSGLFRLEIIWPTDMLPLTYSAYTGDGGAMVRLKAAFDSSARIKRLARKDPVICLTCPRRVRNADAVLALLIPAIETPSVAIASALCSRCSEQDEKTTFARAFAAYTKVWPTLRCVEVTHPEGGRA
jgi:hypothetical protein